MLLIVKFELTPPGTFLFLLCKKDNTVEMCIVAKIEFLMMCNAVQCSIYLFQCSVMMSNYRACCYHDVQCSAV